LEKVAIESCESYNIKELKNLLGAMFEEVSFLPFRNASVLIKPNLLTAKPPEKAVTTNPVMIQAISQLFQDYSCSITIGDSPGYGSIVKVLKLSGIMDIIDELKLNISSFDYNIIKHSNGISPYKKFLFGDDPEKYDIIVNVPKLKTHGMMGMTLGVKNTYGFIHALEKARWHLRAGQDRSLFASILIDIHTIVSPSVTILDGIIGMDGDGPSSGRPRKLGVLAVSKNAFILDDCIEKLVRFPYPTPITRLARTHGLLPEYEPISNNKPVINDFQMPRSMDTDWNIPRFAKNVLRNIFIKKPSVQKNMCKSCGICVKICPAKALSMKDKGPVFDYSLCIRCYCCQEMCPEGAIKT